MKRVLFALALLALPALAGEGHDHDTGDEAEHLATLGALEVLHAWTNAGGREARVYFELRNEGEDAFVLTGAETELGDARLAGFPLRSGGEVVEIPDFAIAPGMAVDFEPTGAFVLIEDMAASMQEGAHFEMHLLFADGQELEIEVEVLSQDATAHPHAGHAH